MVVPEQVLGRTSPQSEIRSLSWRTTCLSYLCTHTTWRPIELGTHADGIALEERHSGTTAVKRDLRSVLQMNGGLVDYLDRRCPECEGAAK
jgi:hypothetical protein